jgi:glycosyltransferase involved in cell wall biosynthesis
VKEVKAWIIPIAGSYLSIKIYWMKKVLFVVSSPGMSSYATGFFRAILKSVEIQTFVVIFTEFDDNRNAESIICDYGLESLDISYIKIIRYDRYKLSLHILTFYNLLVIRNKAQEASIKNIHFLTQDTILASYLWMFKKYNIYYTVHDLEEHSSHLSFVGHIKRFLLLTMKDRWLVKNIDNLVTSSEHQYKALLNIFPKKNIYWHNMPSLITKAIINGVDLVEELAGIKDYVLFFGRIEAYKGIEILYETFIKFNDLKDVKLVIAGKGKIYFNRELALERNVIFINRHIKDEEINDLFNKSKFSVLPYTSATQSAVTSLSYHFNKPIIISNIPGLIDTVIDRKTALFFNVTNIDDLHEKLLQLLESTKLCNHIRLNQIKFRESIFGVNQLKGQLELIYR